MEQVEDSLAFVSLLIEVVVRLSLHGVVVLSVWVGLFWVLLALHFLEVINNQIAILISFPSILTYFS